MRVIRGVVKAAFYSTINIKYEKTLHVITIPHYNSLIK